MSEPIELVVKIETDSIAATKVIVLTLLDVNSGGLQSFSNQPGASPISMAVQLLPRADLVIVQTPFALKILGSLYGLVIDPAKIMDVCALAKQMLPNLSHGLDAWAQRFGVHRSRFRGAPHWSWTAQQHCESDARLVAMVYHTLYEKVDA